VSTTSPLSHQNFSPLRRTVQLAIGLLGFSLTMAMLIHSGMGAMPWDVLHQGLALRTDLPLGVVVVAASVVVMLLWIPLRQRPGIGTIANIAVIGATLDPFVLLLDRIDPDPSIAGRAAIAVAAVVLNGVAGAAYLGARLGAGPRDGLMTGLVARTGWSVRLVKTVIEVLVVALGFALGGTLGWATVLYALGVGPSVQVSARWLAPHLRPAIVPVVPDGDSRLPGRVAREPGPACDEPESTAA
jgi:uncharacterized membrane protein YczE